VRKAANLTTILVPLSRNLGTLTSWNPLGLSRPVMGMIYLYHYSKPELCGLTFSYVLLIINYEGDVIFPPWNTSSGLVGLPRSVDWWIGTDVS
jgi:hypothetical protein